MINLRPNKEIYFKYAIFYNSLLEINLHINIYDKHRTNKNY